MTENSFIKQFTFSPTPTTIDIEFIKWQDREIPKTIYKYRNWGNKYHQRLINNLEVYFPTPQELNDPFDCQRNFDWGELQDPDKNIQYLKIAAKRIEKNTRYSAEEREEILARGLHDKMDAARIAEMEELVREQDDFFNSLTGTFTASLIRDSILLWSHYADSHKGFCIGLDTELLLKTIQHGGSSKAAQYDAKLILTSMLDDIEDAIAEKTFSKYEAWGYEFEYRILAGQLPKNKVFSPPEVFKEIIFGINMRKDHREQLMYRARKKIPSIKFFEAKKARNQYRIEIAEIKG